MHLPIDIKLLYKLSTCVIGGSDFDLVFNQENSLETKWFGNVFADLSFISPFAAIKERDDLDSSNAFESSIERALQIVFTRFALREFSQGIFVVKAQMGQDWFTPILQQPHCILREMSKLPWLKSDTENNLNLGTRKRSATISTSTPTCETSIIFYLGNNVKEFCSAFYSVGLIPGINSWYVFFLQLFVGKKRVKFFKVCFPMISAIQVTKLHAWLKFGFKSSNI